MLTILLDALVMRERSLWCTVWAALTLDTMHNHSFTMVSVYSCCYDMRSLRSRCLIIPQAISVDPVFEVAVIQRV